MSFLNKTIKLAKKGRTSPNPKVGCVIVKEGMIVGEGFHSKAGMPHAEIVALKQAGSLAYGSTLYVNLEPCCCTGRTGPCVDAIIKAGVAKVVVGMKDPNPAVNGKGIALLRENGVEVSVEEFDEAVKLNEAFAKHIVTGMPFVTIKVGMSIDGKIATKTGESKYISGPQSLEYVHLLRDSHDAIMVGSNTVLIDNPKLTCRVDGGRNPIRVVIDGRLRISLDSNVFSDVDEDDLIIATVNGDVNKIRAIEETGARVVVNEGEKVNLKKLMELLGKLGIISVLVEGGSELNAALLSKGLVDKFIVCVSPKIIGGNAKTPVGGAGIESLNDSINLNKITVKQFDTDTVIEGYIDG